MLAELTHNGFCDSLYIGDGDMSSHSGLARAWVRGLFDRVCRPRDPVRITGYMEHLMEVIEFTVQVLGLSGDSGGPVGQSPNHS